METLCFTRRVFSAIQCVMNQKVPSIFDYQDARRFLLDWLLARQSAEATYSVRKWAREMEISHTLLVMLLQGKRSLRLKHAPAFARGMSLESSQKTYLQALIELASSKSGEEEALARSWMRELNPSAQMRVQEIDEFELIASWIHFAVLALCDLESFDGTVLFFERQLKSKATVTQVRAAVTRLQSLGLIIQTTDGKIISSGTHVTTKNDRASSAVRKYHADVSRLAADAVLEQDVLEREFQAISLSVHQDQIPMVKEMIRKFRAELVEAVSTRQGTDVYQCNLQFFRLTERRTELPRAQDEGVDTVSTPLSQGELSC